MSEKYIARRGRYAKIIQTKVVYAHNQVTTCGINDSHRRRLVVPTNHSGGIYEDEQSGTLNVCPRTYSYPGTSGIRRVESKRTDVRRRRVGLRRLDRREDGLLELGEPDARFRGRGALQPLRVRGERAVARGL